MFYDSDAGSLHYQVHGPAEAPAIVFTHGGGLNSGMWDAQVAAVEDHYRAVTWDMPGHGRSAPLTEPLDVPQVADSLIGILDEIGIDSAALVGQSLGVYVNQHAAIRHPQRVSALASIGGLPIDEPMNRFELWGFKAALAVSRLLPESVIFGRAAGEKATTEEAREFFAESMSEMGKEQFLLMLAGQLDACEIEIDSGPRQPMLIAHGEHEMPKSLIEGNRQWHAAVPDSQYLEIPGAGHNANMDNPEIFNAALLEFLADV